MPVPPVKRYDVDRMRLTFDEMAPSLKRGVIPYVVDPSSCDRFFSKERGVYVTPVEETRLLAWLGTRDAETRIRGLTGAVGSGKTTLITKHLWDEQRKAEAHGKRVGWVVLDFSALPADLGSVLNKQPFDRDALEEGTKEAVRASVKTNFVFAGDSIRAFLCWICRQLSLRLQGRTSILQYPDDHSFVDTATAVTRRAFEAAGGDPLNDQAYWAFLEDPLVGMIPALRRDLYEANHCRTRYFLHFLVRAQQFARFYVVFDNVDRVRNECQSVLIQILDSIARRGPIEATGIFSIREDNARSIGDYQVAGRELTVRAMDSETREHYHIKIPFARIESGPETVLSALEAPLRGDTSAPRPRRPLAAVALSRRFRRSADELIGLKPELADVIADLEELQGTILTGYLGEQFFNLLNGSMRDTWEKNERFLAFVLRQSEGQICTLLNADADAREMITASLFYRWLYRESRMLLPNLVEDFEGPRANGIACSLPHLILSFLVNASPPERAAAAMPNLVEVGRVVKELEKLGFSRDDVVRVIWERLYDNGRIEGHLIDFHGDVNEVLCTSASRVRDTDRVWILNRGLESVTTVPYKFYSVIEGVRIVARKDRGIDDMRDVRKEANIVLTFIARIIDHHLVGLEGARRAYSAGPGDQRWLGRYQDRFGIRSTSGGHEFQVQRLIRNASLYLKRLGLHEPETGHDLTAPLLDRWNKGVQHLLREGFAEEFTRLPLELTLPGPRKFTYGFFVDPDREGGGR